MPVIAATVIAYVEQHFTEPISLRDVADAVGYSRAYLTTAFRKETGASVTAWIIRRRIGAAQALLADTGIDVATACEAAGFSDLRYFTRQFRRHVGTTPGRYRHVKPHGAADGPSNARSPREPAIGSALRRAAQTIPDQGRPVARATC